MLIRGPGNSSEEVSNQALINMIESLVNKDALSRPPAPIVSARCVLCPGEPVVDEQRELEDGWCGTALIEAPETPNAGSKPTALVRTEVVVDRDILVAFYDATNGDSWTLQE